MRGGGVFLQEIKKVKGESCELLCLLPAGSRGDSNRTTKESKQIQSRGE